MNIEIRTVTKGANGEKIKAGDSVICINAIVGGDNDAIADWDLKQGENYTVSHLFDDDNLIEPMVVIEGSKNGPVLAERFLLKSERVALDGGCNVLSPGDRVLCLDDSEQGDSGEDFDLKKGQKYVIDSIYDDDNMYAPMICLKDSKSGAVFPERFKKLVSA